MEQSQFWTLVIAIGGLTVGTASFVWNICLHVLNRPKVKITASVMKMDPTPPNVSPDENVIVLEAVNIRSRPVTIKAFYGICERPDQAGRTHFWLRGSSEALVKYMTQFPCHIKEGEVARLMLLKGDFGNDLRDIRYFFAGDTTGRDWYSTRNPFHRQLDELENIKA